MSAKEWWGPRIWRILHSLAEISDRADCPLIWKGVLRATAEIIPCPQCRTHFGEQVRSLHLSVGMAPEVIKETVRDFLWKAHTEASKSSFPKESLTQEYYDGRDSTSLRADGIVEEVFTQFTKDNVLDRFRTSLLFPWKRETLHLSRILRAPELPPSISRSRRTGPRRRVK